MCLPRYCIIYILTRASEVGSPTNHHGSRQRRDTGQGSFSPLTGERNLKLPKIEKDGPTTGPVVLRQGEPGLSQYILSRQSGLTVHRSFFYTLFFLAHLCNLHGGLLYVTFRLSVCLCK